VDDGDEFFDLRVFTIEFINLDTAGRDLDKIN